MFQMYEEKKLNRWNNCVIFHAGGGDGLHKYNEANQVFETRLYRNSLNPFNIDNRKTCTLFYLNSWNGQNLYKFADNMRLGLSLSWKVGVVSFFSVYHPVSFFFIETMFLNMNSHEIYVILDTYICVRTI